MNTKLFNYKIIRDFLTWFSVILLAIFLYVYFSNPILYHTIKGFSIMTIGVIGPTIAFITSFRLKDNILSKLSPVIFVYTMLMFVHILSHPGVDLIKNISGDFYIYAFLSASSLLAIGSLIAVIDKGTKTNSILNLVFTFFVAVILHLINYYVNLPVLLENGTPTTILVIFELAILLIMIFATIIWYLKSKDDMKFKPLGWVFILFVISEILYMFNFHNYSFSLYLASSVRYIALMIILYLIIKFNLILPYNVLYQSLIADNNLQKKLKRDISVSLHRLSKSQEIAHVGTWELDIETKQIWGSEEAFRIYGLPLTENHLLPLNKIQKFVFKKDRPMMDVALMNLIYKDMDYNVHYKILNNLNELRHINSVATLRYKDNKPYKVFGVINDITDLRNEEEKLRYASYHDHLTNVYNRRHFVEKRELVNFESYFPIATVILDINGLKVINDSFGHNVGNRVLKKTADILKDSVADKGFVSRIGGDEFSIICPNTTKSEIEDLMDKTIEIINHEKVENINFSLAYGIAIKDEISQNLDLILKLAEDDMYIHKMSQSQSVRNKIIDALLKTLYENDNVSEEHSQRVSTYAYKLAAASNLSAKKISDIKLAGQLHDIGKVTISNDILNKKGRLTDQEYKIVKTHPEKGYSIIHSIGDMDDIANYVLEHHEYYDGKGYPKGLKGKDISFEARLISIADAYDAMTSFRSYKDEKTKDAAIKELITCKGTQFDPELVDVFIEKVLKMEE